MVDVPSKIITYGYSPKYADLVCMITPYKSHVNLMFSPGTELSDPQHLLEGTGKGKTCKKLRAYKPCIVLHYVN